LSSTRPAARAGTSTPAGNGSDGAQRSLELGPRDRLIGQLYVEGNLRVVGTVEGGLEVTGSVEIDEGGKVTGPVTARDRLIVGRAGSLKGDVRVARLVVQDGATFSGNVSMGKFVEAPPKPVEVVESEPVKVIEPVKVAEVVQAPEATKPAELFKPPQAAPPVKSVQPVKPVRPVTPVLPVKSVQPVKPVQPVTPVLPVKPVQPVKSAQPARPQQPNKPHQKGKRR
jgi:cytoskeletal protein CcmA (bactofilin family)